MRYTVAERPVDRCSSPRRALRLGMFAIVAAALCGLMVEPAAARTLLKNICHVKGQEENTLQGLGLVIGLKGTGDNANSLPTVRSLARAIQLMGTPTGKRGPLELKEDVKNVALVIVTATVPAAGARQGDTIDCTVSSIGGAKSLAGGQFFITALQGPQIESERVYAFAQGAIHIDDSRCRRRASVFKGCRLEEDFFNPFIKDGESRWCSISFTPISRSPRTWPNSSTASWDFNRIRANWRKP